MTEQVNSAQIKQLRGLTRKVPENLNENLSPHRKIEALRQVTTGSRSQVSWGIEFPGGRNRGQALEEMSRRKGPTSSSAFALNSFDRSWASRCPSVNLGFQVHVTSTTVSTHPHAPLSRRGQKTEAPKAHPSPQSYRPFFAYYDNDRGVDQHEECRGGIRTSICPYRVANRKRIGA